MASQTYNRKWLYGLGVLIAAITILLINPVGFVGGGQDDGRYLEAAQCWASHGPCLPQNHWEGRWPVFAPMALLITWLGETRVAVQLWPLICSMAAIALLFYLAHRLFGPCVAVLATLLVLAKPAFSIQLVTPSVEALEFGLVLAAVLVVVEWRESQNSFWAFAAGICFGLAFQVRETALVAAGCVAVFAFLIGLRPTARDILSAFVGFCLPLAVEFVVYYVASGDFFYRRNLSLSHTRLPSSELARSVDTSASPIFNADIIGGWRREPGFHVHWLVDGPLNLLLNAKAGFSLLLTPLLLFVYRKSIPDLSRRSCWWLLAFAAAYVAGITYVFAMDPKPRVMLIGLAAGSIAFAIVLENLWAMGRRLMAAVCLIAALLGGIYILAGYLRPSLAERQALKWASQYPQQIEIDRMTRMMLTLKDELRSMPTFEAEKPYFLTVSTSDCQDWLVRAQLGNDDMIALDGRALALFQTPGEPGAWICLFRYRRPISAPEMRVAVRLVWADKHGAGGGLS